MKQPKTAGLEWLYLSMASFNGSGYADKSDPSTYVKSYIAYKRMKKKKDAVELVQANYDAALMYAERLVKAAEAGHTPSEKSYTKFMNFYNAGGGEL